MRSLWLAGFLLVVLALGVVHTERSVGADPSAPPAGASGTAAVHEQDGTARAAAPRRTQAAAVLSAGEVSVVGDAAGEPMVRYFDDQGSLHMVRGMASVPPAYRERAVVLGKGHVNVVSIPAPSAVAFRDWQPEGGTSASHVVLFSAPWCGACNRARRHLDQRGVRYEERDIDEDPAARADLLDILGRIAVPLLDVDGRFISGFRPDVYDRAFEG